MAEGYAHATGRPGVAMVTSGPAATNIVTPLCDAYMDSVPMVVHHRPGAARRRSAPTPSRSATPPASPSRSPSTTSWSPRPPTSRWSIREAFHLATTGRPGPVLVDIPKDIVDPTNPALGHGLVLADRRGRGRGRCPATGRATTGDPEADRAGRRADPRRRTSPVIYAGGGILKARAAEALRELAELTDIHVVTTLMARGAFPDDHPLCLGMPGMHGNYTAVTVDAAERPADRARRPLRRPGHRQGRRRSPPTPRSSTSTSTPPSSARSAGPTSPIDGDCRLVIEELVKAVRRCSSGGGEQPDRSAVEVDASAAGRSSTRSPTSRRATASRSSRRWCSSTCATRSPRTRSSCSGVGQHQMWASQYWKFRHPYTWVNSGGLGTMGFSVPAAIGAKVGPARPHGVGGRRRRLLPDDRPGARHRHRPSASRSRSPSSTTPTSAWSASGRRCSTRSATPRCTCRPTCPTT